jgi:ribonuclease HII
MAKLYAFDESRRAESGPLLAGVDEAGRGSWAGPVVAAAVVLRPESRFKGLNDSKLVAPEDRERLFDEIRRDALFHAVSVVEAAVVDEVNILQATFIAMRRSLFHLSIKPDRILVDGNRAIPETKGAQETVVKGDGRSASIAAASILAKVTRDRIMVRHHDEFPAYDFASNKGYGTPLHQEALRRHGPCAIHRRTYAPVIESLSPLLPF